MTKVEVVLSVKKLLLKKKQDLQEMFDDLQDGLANDTKSSAGDKYETSREMSQQEVKKIAAQLAEVNRQLALLHQLEAAPCVESITSGTLVQTTGGYFLIGVPVGTISVNGVSVYCISATAPMAQAFIHKKAGETLSFNGKTWQITAIS
jgi:hypothetical protein